MRVILSSRLKTKYPGVFESLTLGFERYKIEFQILPYSKDNEWVRDYMPVKNRVGEYILFKYSPHYLQTKKGIKTIPPLTRILDELQLNVKTTELILDGGSILVNGDKVFVSSIVFEDNKPLKPLQIRELLQNLFLTNEVYFIPYDPWDFTGHLDSLLRPINADKLVINEYSCPLHFNEFKNNYANKLAKTWYYSFFASLFSSGNTILERKLLFYGSGKSSSAIGCYLNFFRTEEVLFLPAFSSPNDTIVAKSLEEVFQLPVFLVPCSDLAREGGALNCVTWELD